QHRGADLPGGAGRRRLTGADWRLAVNAGRGHGAGVTRPVAVDADAGARRLVDAGCRAAGHQLAGGRDAGGDSAAIWHRHLQRLTGSFCPVRQHVSGVAAGPPLAAALCHSAGAGDRRTGGAGSAHHPLSASCANAERAGIYHAAL
ncbi:ubiquinol-cytochrome c reductase iron-sulfur subunit, partial [Corchorus olitorius]